MANIVVTPEYVQSLGEDIRRMVIRTSTPKERLEGLSAETVIAQFAPETVIAQFAPETVIAQFALEDRLAGVDLALIEEYLRQQKQAANKKSASKKVKARKSSKF